MGLGIGPNPQSPYIWPFEKSSNSYFVNSVLYSFGNKLIKLHL